MRKGYTILLLTLCVLLFSSSVYAEHKIKVAVDGKFLEGDALPIVMEGRTLVPLKAIFEALNAKVEWKEESKTILGTKDNTKIILTVNSKSATANDRKVELDAPATVVNGRTMVPIRFIAESLGADINWQAETKTIIINSDKSSENYNNIYGNSSANINNVGLATKQGDWIYYQRSNYYAATQTTPEILNKVRVDGTNDTPIKRVAARWLNVVGDWIYYNDIRNKTLSKIKIDGTEETVLTKDDAKNVHVVEHWIYYTNASDDRKLYKIRTDGTGRIKLSDDYIYSISVIGDWIYYQVLPGAKYSDAGIYRIRTDGTNKTKFIDNNGQDFNVVGDWIYYKVLGQKLYRISSDGKTTNKISDDEIYDFNISDGWIYYTITERANQPKFYKIRTDGTEKTLINDDAATHINVVGDWIYYQNPNVRISEKLLKVRTDGTQRQFAYPLN